MEYHGISEIKRITLVTVGIASIKGMACNVSVISNVTVAHKMVENGGI